MPRESGRQRIFVLESTREQNPLAMHPLPQIQVPIISTNFFEELIKKFKPIFGANWRLDLQPQFR